MKAIQKKQIFMFSDGSILNNKTYLKMSNKVKILRCNLRLNYANINKTIYEYFKIISIYQS